MALLINPTFPIHPSMTAVLLSLYQCLRYIADEKNLPSTFVPVGYADCLKNLIEKTKNANIQLYDDYDCDNNHAIHYLHWIAASESRIETFLQVFTSIFDFSLIFKL